MKKKVQRIYFKLITKLIGELKYWGIAFETDLPPEFVITNHALERINLRFKCKPTKIKRTVFKAWNHGTQPHPEFINRKLYRTGEYKGSIYRVFQGHVFIFKTRYDNKLGVARKTLITVHEYKSKRPTT